MGTRRGVIFNEEKVLFFANHEQAFHVQPNEPKDSDCRRIVDSLVSRGMLSPLSTGSSGEFFRITTKGKVQLVELQIKWRQSRGKDVTGHREELAALLCELSEERSVDHAG